MINKKTNKCRQCIYGWKNFQVLNDDELDLIDCTRQEAHFKAGEIIFKEGAPTSSAVFISSGYAKLHIEGYDHKNLILALAKPGWFIAGPGTYVDSRHHYSCTALTNCYACFVDIDVIKDLVHSNRKFAEGYLKDISSKSLNNFSKMISLTQKKMPGRLAESIVYLSENVFLKEDFDCFLSRQELGELSGMTKESVVRILKELSSDDIIEVNKSKISIKNMNKLKEIMQNG